MYNIKNLINLKSEVKKEHLNFDLGKFMLASDGNIYQSGVLLITPSQVVMVNCFIKNSCGLYEHGDTLDAIYSAIYNKNSCIYRIYENNFDITWQDIVTNDGNILVLLCNGIYSWIWIPEKISRNQYYSLVSFNDKIKEIYEKNREFFDKHMMEFGFVLSDEEWLGVNNIDFVLASVEDRIDDVEIKKETIIGDDIREIGINLIRTKIKSKNNL